MNMSGLSFALITFTFFYSAKASSQCVIIAKLSNYRVYYGNIQEDLNLTQCISYCSTDPTCKAFDWDRLDPGCFTFTNATNDADIHKLHANESVDHYTFIKKPEFCTGEFKTEIWTPEINQSSSGKKDRAEVFDLETCVESCLQDINCKGVDWAQFNKSCWLVKETSSLIGSNGTYHYNRIRIPNVAIDSQTHASESPFTAQTSRFTGETQKQTVTDKSALETPTSTSANQLNGVKLMDSEYPLSLKPEYIVLIGLSLGCILMALTAVVVIITRRTSKNFSSKKNNSLSDDHSFKLNGNSFFNEPSGSVETLDKLDKFDTKYHGDNEVEEAEQTLDMLH